VETLFDISARPDVRIKINAEKRVSSGTYSSQSVSVLEQPFFWILGLRVDKYAVASA
jgi:hypothetical protein